MLFKTTDELREYYPFVVSFEFQVIKTFILSAERKYIIPAVSQAQFDALQAAYDASLLTPEQNKLLDRIRIPLANLAALLFIPSANVHVGTGGITVSSTDTDAPASQWRIEDLKRAVMDAGFAGMDELIQFLADNITDYPLYAASSEFQEQKSSFINNAKTFSKFANINGNRWTYLQMFPVMRRIEEYKIRSLLCNDLFNQIKTEISAGTLTAANKTLLEKYIQPAIAHFTIAAAVTELSIKISDRGITVILFESESMNVRGEKPADHTQVALLKKENLADAENFLKQMRDFLHKNITDYPLFENSDCYDANFKGEFENDDLNSFYAAL